MRLMALVLTTALLWPVSRDIVLQWLTAHPATRHNAATHEALAALLAAFPCK